MKFCTSLVAAWLILAAGVSTANAQATLYWDINGTSDGATDDPDGIGDGTWNLNGATNWNTEADGGAAGTIGPWTNPAASYLDHAVFSAGDDINTDPLIGGAFITVDGTQSAASVTIEEGFVALRTGAVDTPLTTVKSGAILEVDSILRFSALPGKITLQGGEYRSSNFGHAGSYIRGTQTLEIDGTGIIDYDDTVARTATDCQCTIYTPAAGQAITGVGGTPTAGTGTLIKTGAGEIRVQGPQLANFSFQKLLVEGGLYRIGSTAGSTEVGFGAAPAAGVLTDAITLDGGQIGASLALTLHANRGITIGANGGMFNNGGAGVITIPGPLTGSGTMTVGGAVLSPTSANHGVSSGGTTLSNAGNTSTFSGNVVVDASTLTLAESLITPQFSGGITVNPPAGIVFQSVTTIGTVSIATGKMFTVGSADTSTSYAGRVTGLGTFRKVGTGILTMDAGQTDHDPASTVTEFNGQWTNTGGVIIDGGALRFGNGLAGFGTTTPVTVNNTATLDMNNINDTFGALQSDGGNTTGQVLQGTGELTLAAASGSRTYEGTITGTGIFRKGRALPTGAGDVATQILTGNNSLGAVEVNAGSLLFNGTNTTGAVTVNGGTLGGSGSVSGAVTANSGGHIAPGASIGTLSIAGGLTLEIGSVLDFELGAPSTGDLINVTGGTTTINGGSVSLTDAGGLAAGTYTLIDYVGTLGGDVANLGTPTGPAGFSFSLVDTGSVINLDVMAVAVGLLGDFNEDDIVDASDYVTWRKNAANNSLPNDNGLGTQAERYDLWTANFGNMAGSGSGLGAAAVPEPASLALLMLGLVPVAFGRRSR